MTPAFAGERHRSTRHKAASPQGHAPPPGAPTTLVVIRTCRRTACLSGPLRCRSVADPANIDSALECGVGASRGVVDFGVEPRCPGSRNPAQV